ncbi:hypothetical protein NN561_019084 [Cricetulus griseus]
MVSPGGGGGATAGGARQISWDRGVPLCSAPGRRGAGRCAPGRAARASGSPDLPELLEIESWPTRPCRSEGTRFPSPVGTQEAPPPPARAKHMVRPERAREPISCLG